MSLALVFPGQGAQYVGMAKDFYDANEAAKKVIDLADAITAKGLKKVMFEGPEEELKKTDYTQPAIFTMSCAIYEALKDKFEGKAVFTAGHSLGEYSALYAAGAFDLETGIKLVAQRGAFMQDASAKTKSGMAAVLNLDMAKVNELCEKVKGAGYLTTANINCPGQIVVSGEIAAVDAGEAVAKELGAKRYVKLAVAGAFHSKVMQPAADGLKGVIGNFAIKDTAIPVVANFSAGEVRTAAEINSSLVSQITGPVRWIETVEYMKAKGVDTFVEIGPGAVLSGLIKKIYKEAKIFNVDKLGDVVKLEV